MATNASDSMNRTRNHQPRVSRRVWLLLLVLIAGAGLWYASRDQMLLISMRWRTTNAIVGCRGLDSPFVYYRLSRAEASQLIGQVMRSTSRAEFNKTNVPPRLSVFLFDSDNVCFGRILVKAAYGSSGKFIDSVRDDMNEHNVVTDVGFLLNRKKTYYLERSCK